MITLKWSHYPAALLLLGFLTQSSSAQSDVRGTLTETTAVTNSAALAIGNGANSNIGGISVSNSRFSGVATSTTVGVNSARC